MRADRRALLLGAAAALAAGRGVAQAAPAPLRLLCFGDSLFSGPNLAPDDQLPAQLAARLAMMGAPPLRLRVAALSGDTSYGGRVRIHWALRRAADAVLVAIGGNDMLLGWPAARAEANLDAILARAGDGGRPVLLLGIRAIGGSAAFRAEWDAIWPRLAARPGAALVPDLHAPLRRLAPQAARALMQADGIHANAAGNALLAGAIAPQALALLRAAEARRRG